MRLTILQLKGVGPQNAKALEKAGYYYAEELALIPVENVSKQTGIPESELQRFKTFVHLMRIKSIGPNYANLLYRDDVRIFNLNDLAKAQPEDLYQKLKKSNRNKRLVKVLPTSTKLKNGLNTHKKESSQNIIHFMNRILLFNFFLFSGAHQSCSYFHINLLQILKTGFIISRK